MRSDSYFEGNLFEEKIGNIFIRNKFPTILLNVNDNKNFLEFTARTNKIHGDGLTITKDIKIFWDSKLHEFISLGSGMGFSGHYYILSEKYIGGSKEEFDLERIWVVEASAVKLTFTKIINQAEKLGIHVEELLDFGPASGDPGIFLNLTGNNPGQTTQLSQWAKKISLKDFIENNCIWDLSIHKNQALKDEEKYNKEHDYSQFVDL